MKVAVIGKMLMNHHYCMTVNIFPIRSKWIRVDGVLYKKPAVILSKVEQDTPVFVQIVDVYIVDNKPLAYCQQFNYINNIMF